MLLACRVHSEIQAMVRVVLSELHLIRTSVFYVIISLFLFHIILGEGWQSFVRNDCGQRGLPSNASKELECLFVWNMTSRHWATGSGLSRQSIGLILTF